MTTRTHRSVRTLLVAAAAFASASGVALATGTSDLGVLRAPVEQTATGSPDRAIDRARTLMDEGKHVQARAMLLAVAGTDAGVTLTDAQRTQAFEMLTAVERRIRSADPLDVALQKAELAIVQDDLRAAERHAREVVGAEHADSGQRDSARAVLDVVRDRREALQPVIGGVIEQAASAFEDGAYAESKSLLERVQRTGVELDSDERRILEHYRGRIVDLEFARGEVFESGPALLGMLNPTPAANMREWLLDDNNGQPQPDGDNDAPDDNDEPERDLVDTANRLEAQRLLSQADTAFEARRLNEAEQNYTQLWTRYRAYLSEEEQAHVRDRRDEARVLLRGQPGEGLDRAIGDRELSRQRVLATFENEVEQARAALETGDTNAARDLAASARLTLSRGRDVLPEAQFRELLERSENLLAQINRREEEIRVREAERREAEIRRRTLEAEREMREERDRKISEALNRVRALQMDLKYQEALQVVDQILFLDPNHPAGLLLKDVLEDTLIYRQFGEVRRDHARGIARMNIENQRAMVLPDDLMNYPDDWREKSLMRGGPMQFTESPQNRAVLATLEQNRIPVNFADNALIDVIAFLANVTNLNVDVDWASLEDIGVQRESPVSLQLTNVSVRTALERVLDKVSDPDLRAGWAVYDGILTIASDEVLRRNTVLEIYDIRDLLIEVPDYDGAPEFSLDQVLQQQTIGAGGGGAGGQSPFQDQQRDIDRVPREDRVNQIVEIIQSNIDPDGWDTFGGETGSIQELNGNLIIRNTPKNHRAIIGLLSKLREVRAMQINVEARFLLVSTDFFEQIGFDIDVYFGGRSNEFQIARTIDPSLRISDFFGPDGELLRNVSGGGIFVPGEDGEGGAIIQPVFAPGTQGDRWSPIRSEQGSLGLANQLIGGGFAADVLSGGPALGISGMFLDDIQVDFLIEATQADRRSVTLTAPRLTFTNGQTANIVVATQRAFVSSLSPVVSDSAVAFDPELGVVSEGVRLVIDGVISADRRYVTLNIDTSIATVDEIRIIESFGGAGGGGLGGEGVPIPGFIEAPTITVTQVQTTATIPDEGTLLLGGQRLMSESEVETGVPVLSKIPVINRFFTNRIETKEEQTLLILMKPTILIQNEQEEKNFPGLLDELGY